MNHKDFYETGICLDFQKDEQPAEVAIRNAMGRIYYYIYHEALQWVFSNDELKKIYDSLEKNFPSTHLRLFKTFFTYAKNTQKLEYGTVCRHLGNLHRDRCDADYELEESIGKSNFFSMLANLESLKIVSQQINSEVFHIQTNLHSVNTPTPISATMPLADGKGTIKVVKKPSLRILD